MRKLVSAIATGKATVSTSSRSTLIELVVSVEGIRGDRTLRLHPTEAEELGLAILQAAGEVTDRENAP